MIRKPHFVISTAQGIYLVISRLGIYERLADEVWAQDEYQLPLSPVILQKPVSSFSCKRDLQSFCYLPTYIYLRIDRAVRQSRSPLQRAHHLQDTNLCQRSHRKNNVLHLLQYRH